MTQPLELTWEQFTNDVVLVLESQPLSCLANFDGAGLNYAARLMHAALGMATEVPELIEAYKNGDGVNAMEELGDIYWYAALALHLAPHGSIRESLNTSMTWGNRYPSLLNEYQDKGRVDFLITNLNIHKDLLTDLCKSGFFYGVWANPDHAKNSHSLTTTLATLAVIINNAAELAYATVKLTGTGEQYLLPSGKINQPFLLGRIAAKLEKRYPAGHFEAMSAAVRDLQAERKELEA